MSARERQALQGRCIDRGVAALALAIEQGYDNVRRLDGDMREVGIFWNLRNHPEFPKLVEILSAKHRD